VQPAPGMPRRLCYDAALRSARSCGFVLPDEPEGGALSPPATLKQDRMRELPVIRPGRQQLLST
jgi:hypothetical protein